MILAQISNNQRVALVRFAQLGMARLINGRPPLTPAYALLENLVSQVMNGYQDHDGVLFELTRDQRSLVVEAAHQRMNVLGSRPNGWLHPEYATLESLVYNLMVDCAD